MQDWAIEIIGAAAAIVGTICWLPQSIKTIRTRQTQDLSLGSNLLVFLTVLLWFLYGIALHSWPLIGANVISMLLVGIIIILKLKHG